MDAPVESKEANKLGGGVQLKRRPHKRHRYIAGVAPFFSSAAIYSGTRSYA